MPAPLVAEVCKPTELHRPEKVDPSKPLRHPVKPLWYVPPVNVEMSFGDPPEEHHRIENILYNK